MTTATAALTAREYLRVSVDTPGTERSPEQQHAEHSRTAADLGIILGKPDNIGSASRYASSAPTRCGCGSPRAAAGRPASG
ncbi:hypothetical protein [Streptomyces sp. NRRL S-646]|uniref:hypothetical protein n=1 Tax=Streptomyces sp. NRRL S-646 TaxID=1463917 RepID=UPI0004CA969D|nr:hypothetical protein [Streptomyces sp. NRRL S-646]